MNRWKTVGWMLLVIILIGVVAILTRTPVGADARSEREGIEAPAPDTSADDTVSTDSAAENAARSGQNSSQ